MPAKRMREVFVPGPARLSRTVALFETAKASRLDDAHMLAQVVQQLESAIAEIGLASPAIMPEVEQKPLGMLGSSPEAFKKFFDVDLETSLGRAFMGG